MSEKNQSRRWLLYAIITIWVLGILWAFAGAIPAGAQTECFYDQDGNWVCISAVRFGPAAYLPIIWK